MPEYGLCDKSPEELEEEQLNQELTASFQRMEAIEAKARQRKADAENSNIETAKMLRQMMEQMQAIQDTQKAERKARIEAERRAEIYTRMQTRENRLWQAVGVTIGLLTLAATVLFGILALLH